jgi:hypothetical protein
LQLSGLLEGVFMQKKAINIHVKVQKQILTFAVLRKFLVNPKNSKHLLRRIDLNPRKFTRVSHVSSIIMSAFLVLVAKL